LDGLNHWDINLFITALTISCCLSDLEKSDVEYLDLAYIKAVFQSILFTQELTWKVIYPIFQSGYVESVIGFGILISSHPKVSITFSKPWKSIKA
jgi:hypothetical protein